MALSENTLNILLSCNRKLLKHIFSTKIFLRCSRFNPEDAIFSAVGSLQTLLAIRHDNDGKFFAFSFDDRHW
jgi:hypothetical protein